MLFPGALGDFLCFLPTVDALRESLREEITVVARQAFHELIANRPFATTDIERREIAGLFSDAPPQSSLAWLGGFERAFSWTGASDPTFRSNLAAVVAGPVEVFPFRDFHSGEHATERFARCVGLTAGPTRIAIPDAARSWARALSKSLRFDSETLLIHPGSGSAAKNWLGMADLAAAWRRAGGRAVALVGPADQKIPDVEATISEPSIARVAAILERAPLYVGNDSGISHLAATVACRGLALFADSDPSVWRPRGDSIAVVRATRACSTCPPATFCTHRLGVADVLQRVDRHRAESYLPRP